MLKTCLKCDLLWLKDGEGPDLSRGERSDKNSQESLRDLRFGARESEREHLCSWVCSSEVFSPNPKWVGDIYNPSAKVAVVCVLVA